MRLAALVLASAMLAVGSARTDHADEISPVLESQFTTTPPRLDGFLDGVWQTASPLTLSVRKAMGGQNPKPVTIRALHTHDTLYILAQWPDATRSDLRDPYVWNPEKEVYERPSKPDDQFAIEFPLQGEFDLSMLSLKRSYVADVWHWKAGRGNPVGWVDDKRHIISQEPVAGAVRYSMGGHGEVYIARPLDEGTASYAVKLRPQSFQAEVVDSFEHREPTGSLADLRGKGVHDGRMWTLEMARKFITGHADDAVLDPGRQIQCAIAVLDDELYWEHTISPVFTLRFANEPLAGAGSPNANNPSGRRWDFEDATLGHVPKYVETPRGQWEVQEISDAPLGPRALVQIAQSPGPYFNLAVIRDVKFRDLRLSVKLKPLAGKVDQGGGVVWRYRDAENYYVARANPLEHNFRVYRVVGGKREMVLSAEVTAEAQQWHTIAVTMRGDQIVCELDGRQYLETQDKTFPDPGRIGLWTKADASTAFDEFQVESVDPAGTP